MEMYQFICEVEMSFVPFSEMLQAKAERPSLKIGLEECLPSAPKKEVTDQSYSHSFSPDPCFCYWDLQVSSELN